MPVDSQSFRLSCSRLFNEQTAKASNWSWSRAQMLPGSGPYRLHGNRLYELQCIKKPKQVEFSSAAFQQWTIEQ